MNIFKNDLTTNAFYFKLGYLILCLLGTVAFIQPYSVNFFKVILLYGALILLIDLVTRRELFKGKYFIYQLIFILFMGLSVLVNWDNGLIVNLSVLAYTITQVFLLTFIGVEKGEGYADKELFFFSKIIIAFFTIYMVISILMYFFNVSYSLILNDERIYYFGVTPFGRFHGLSSNTNHLGIQSTILIMITLINFKKIHKSISCLSIIVGFVCLVMSESLGAKLALIAFLSFFIFFNIYNKLKNKRVKENIISFVLVFVISIGSVQIADVSVKKLLNSLPTISWKLKNEENTVSKDDNEFIDSVENNEQIIFDREISSSLQSGRIELWLTGLNVAKENIIFGVGEAESIKQIVEFDDSLAEFSKLSNVHNILLDVLIKYGVFSLVSFVVFGIKIIFDSFNKIFTQKKYKMMFLYSFSIIASLFIYNMVEVNILFYRTIINFVFCIALGYVMNFNDLNKDTKKDKFTKKIILNSYMH